MLVDAAHAMSDQHFCRTLHNAEDVDAGTVYSMTEP
jgi:hypothetical protein